MKSHVVAKPILRLADSLRPGPGSAVVTEECDKTYRNGQNWVKSGVNTPGIRVCTCLEGNHVC